MIVTRSLRSDVVGGRPQSHRPRPGETINLVVWSDRRTGYLPRPEAGPVYGAIDMPWAKLVGQIAQAYVQRLKRRQPLAGGRRRTSAALADCHFAAHAAILELTLFAALAMSAATASGFEIYIAWLPAASAIVEPARVAIWR
jgi:hypothetical protein